MEKTDLEVMMMDGCTKLDAEKHLKSGSMVFDDFAENLEMYLDVWDEDADCREELRKMVETGKPADDWGVVKDGEKTYFIMYIL